MTTADIKSAEPASTKKIANGTKKFYNGAKAPLLEKIKEADLSKVAIFLGMGVDPDGLASQAVMAEIITLLDGTAECFYRGTFNRPENRVFRQILNLNPHPESEFDSSAKWTCIISVDGSAEACPIKPDFIIDHHEQTDESKVASDIRLIGACSSMMWEYALEAGVDFESENGQRLATALAVGIKTDTRDGAVDAAGTLDYKALAYCLSHKDNKLYKEVIRYSRPAYYHDLFVVGWTNKLIEGAVLVTGIGSIPVTRSGIISDLAEKFVGTEGVHTAVVFAIVDGAIDISVRSENSALNVSEFVQTAFGGGGGKPGAGRVRIPMPLFENIPEDLSDMLFESCFNIVKHKALQIAGDKK
jgi:nanoRNase/pAp phosphatase (c-di-AMP/oligoRNAs hydrolase)